MSTSNNLATTNSKKKEKRANGQGSIYLKKGTTKYIVAVFDVTPDGKTIRRRKTMNTKKEAEAFLYEFRRNQGMGGTSFAVNPKMRLGEFMENWLDTLALESETMRSYRTAVKCWIKPQIGHVLVSGVKPRLIETHYKNLADSFSGSVLHITHTALMSAFSDAFRLGEIPFNPMLSVKKLTKPSNKRTPIPSKDAAKIYAEASKDPYMQARIEIGMMKILRPGEVMGLKWSDIDWDLGILTCSRQVQEVKGQGLVFKPRKTKDVIVLKLSEAQMEILRIHELAQQTAKVFWRKDEGLIFPNSTGNKKSPKADTRDWKRILASAGISKNYVRYQMKHTGVTNLITHGVDEKTTATLAGHSSSTVTMKHYASATSESMENALLVQDAFRPSPEQIAKILQEREVELLLSARREAN